MTETGKLQDWPMWNRPIIVTGCARSGTSLVAGILANCGAWTGRVTGPTRWNRKGQFENEAIRDELTKPFLKSLGVDPLGQKPLPDSVPPDRIPSSWRWRVENVLRTQNYPGDVPWMFKGAKACLIWEVWNQAFPEAQWVVVRRDDSRIIDSCMKTSFMRKRTTREEWQEWVDHHKRKFEEMRNAMPGRVWSVDSKLAVSGNGGLDTFKYLVSWLGLTWREKAVREFIDPDLWSG